MFSEMPHVVWQPSGCGNNVEMIIRSCLTPSLVCWNSKHDLGTYLFLLPHAGTELTYSLRVATFVQRFSVCDFVRPRGETHYYHTRHLKCGRIPSFYVVCEGALPGSTAFSDLSCGELDRARSESKWRIVSSPQVAFHSGRFYVKHALT